MKRYIDADKLKRSLYIPYTSIIKISEAIIAQIDAQQTADVRENVRGEWRTTHLDHVSMGERPKILYCSVCNQCIAYPTNFCPNCGADMRGEQCE